MRGDNRASQTPPFPPWRARRGGGVWTDHSDGGGFDDLMGRQHGKVGHIGEHVDNGGEGHGYPDGARQVAVHRRDTQRHVVTLTQGHMALPRVCMHSGTKPSDTYCIFQGKLLVSLVWYEQNGCSRPRILIQDKYIFAFKLSN